MAKEITSTDWHLEGVSVEVRRLVAAYCSMSHTNQGALVDRLLRESPQLKALAKFLAQTTK
jgi:hypothetical protein